MIEIRMSESFVQKLSDKGVNLNSYVIQIGESKYFVPSLSNQIYANDVSSGQVAGGPAHIKIRPYQGFGLLPVQFEILVNSSFQGSQREFLNNLVYLVDQEVLEVYDSATPATPLTIQQIFNYQAA